MNKNALIFGGAFVMPYLFRRLDTTSKYRRSSRGDTSTEVYHLKYPIQAGILSTSANLFFSTILFLFSA